MKTTRETGGYVATLTAVATSFGSTARSLEYSALAFNGADAYLDCRETGRLVTNSD